MWPVFMRDRRGIDKLLTAETLESMLVLPENPSWSSQVREESLKCIVNLVYSRPEFVSGIFVPKGYISRLLALATHEGTASMHWLVWKILLVSCEASEVPRYLSCSLEAWQLVHKTLFYSFHHGNQLEVIEGARSTLLIDLVKLVTVLVNDTLWTAEQEQLMPEVFRTIHSLGGLLLEILSFKHRDISPLNENLVELKNKAMEVFMFLPGSLLAAFIQQQYKGKSDPKESLLLPMLDHLHTMLLATRIEKTRPLKEMLPTLIVCYNLAKTGDSKILACFKQAILPEIQSEPLLERTKALFFKQLKFFLTCLDTDVRRYTSEWLFLLSDENTKTYTHHTGVGNAIGLLRMKGLA
ncbi:Synembryn-A [Phytophthora citrophthora]|uniref:Synembryn-A n=1 Tax=Phytophthora citrophthora TaxID=4793 RepID=A0AAD9GZQ8_9STRA|nr:Synembryn-A [Phytophthora citrophthora]